MIYLTVQEWTAFKDRLGFSNVSHIHSRRTMFLFFLREGYFMNDHPLVLIESN